MTPPAKTFMGSEINYPQGSIALCRRGSIERGFSNLPNDSGNVGKWRIWMPDGTVRYVKGTTSSGYWITGVAHGLYMDMTPVGSYNGSSSTYYTDTYWISTATGRVVYRGNNYADAYGGVSCVSASNDASYSYASVGSRLAFRGLLVKAQSVAAYKALSEVA